MSAWRTIWRFAGVADDVRGRLSILWWLFFIGAAALTGIWVIGVHHYGAFGTALLVFAAVLFILGLAGFLSAGRRGAKGSHEPIESVMPKGGRRLHLRVDASGLELGDADDRGDITITLPISITNREPTPVRLDVRFVIRKKDAPEYKYAIPAGSGHPEPFDIEGYGSTQHTLSFSLDGRDVMFFGTILKEPRVGAVSGLRRRPLFPEGSLAVSLEDHISGGKKVIDLPIYEPTDVELPPPASS